jgi:hypothetical protein
MISEERVRYLIEQLGADVTAKQVDKLAKSFLDSSKAANQHSGELKANARMAEVYARQAERTAAAQKSALAGVGQAATTAGTAMSGFAQNAARTTQTLGAFTSAASGLIPGIEGMGGAVGRASGVIQGMTSAIGGGPAGLVIGGVVAALGVYSLYAKKAAEDTLALARAQEEEAEASHQSRLRRLENAAGFSAFAKATGATADIRARIALQNLGEQDAEANQRALDAINAAEKAAFGDRLKGGGPARPAPFNPTRGDRLAETEALVRRAQAEADAAKRQREFGEQFSKVAQSGDAAGDKVRAQLDREFSIKQAARERDRNDVLSQHEMELKLYDEKEARIQAFHGTVRDGAKEAWMMAGGAAANAFAAIARGEKVSLKAILQSLGSQAIAAGTMKLFEAAAMAFTFNPAAAGMAAVGAGQIAFGATLAGAGSGGGPSGAGGGGRESGRTPIAPTFAQPTGPSFGNPSQARPVVYQFPAIISPTSREGQLVQMADEERRRQGR